MEQTFERVKDRSGEPIPGLFVRQYGTKDGRISRRFYGIFTDWKGIRRRFPLGSDVKTAARNLADKLRKNDAEFDFDESQNRHVTLTQWAEKCASALKERDLSNLVHLKSFFGAKLLSRITDKDLLDYRAKRATEKVQRHGKPANKLTSHTTINKELGLLRKLLRLAQADAAINRLPTFKMEKEPSRERVLSSEEYQALLENSPAWLRGVCVAAYETALSRGDLLGLTWDEIDRKNWVIRLSGGRDKTKVRQEMPIRTEALTELFSELETERKKLPNTDKLVFTKDGQRIKKMVLRRALQAACKAAEVENFTFHDFRHCAVTNWHRLGVPAEFAMRMAGHSSVQSHKKYVNLGTQDLIEVFTSCLHRQSTPTKKSATA